MKAKEDIIADRPKLLIDCSRRDHVQAKTSVEKMASAEETTGTWFIAEKNEGDNYVTTRIF